MCCKNYSRHCDYIGSDVTILALYSLQDLYLAKMKNALFVALESRYFCAYMLQCMSILAHTHWMNVKSINNNTSWSGKTLILPCGWGGPGAHCVAMEMSHWRKYHGTFYEYHCEKFQSSSEICESTSFFYPPCDVL